MRRILIPTVFASVLFSLAFLAAPTRAAETAAAPQTVTPAPQTLTPAPQILIPAPPSQTPALDKLAEFKNNLPGNAEELYADQFQALQKQGGYVVLDLRSKESFARQHLKGSISAPLTDLTEKTLPQLVPDKTTSVVLACDYSFAPTRMIPMTLQAYPVLKTAGYSKIYRLNLWDNADHHMVTPQEQPFVFEGTDVPPLVKK